MDWEDRAILQEFRQQQRDDQQRWRSTHVVARKHRIKMSNLALAELFPRLETFGPVNLTTHKAGFDVWVGGCRVEFKASHWQDKRNRYQADVRHHQGDILIFDAINGTHHYFVIPMATVFPRRKIEVYSYDVARCTGQWAAYLENWDVLRQAVNDTPDRVVQMDFGI